MFIFRAGLPIAVPASYAADPAHAALVAKLTGTNRFEAAVGILEQNPEVYLAADILSGAPWAQRYLNTMGKLWAAGDRKLAQRASRALLGVLAGVKPKVGRNPGGPLTPAQAAAGAAAIARWRVHVDAAWGDRPTLSMVLTRAAVAPLSLAHRNALRALVRRPGVRKGDVVLNLASWETGLPLRRLKRLRPVADLVYG